MERYNKGLFEGPPTIKPPALRRILTESIPRGQ
jgi:hypothetical protein